MRAVFVLGGFLLSFSGCRFGFDVGVEAGGDDAGDGGTDLASDASNTGDASDAGAACTPFGPARSVDGINSGKTEFDPTISADQLTLYFTSNRNSSEFEVWMARRADPASGFGPPVRDDALSAGTSGDFVGTLSVDGLEIFVWRVGGGVLRYVRTSSGAIFGSPEPVSIPGVNPGGGVWLAADGVQLVFGDHNGSGTDPRSRLGWAARTSTVTTSFAFIQYFGALESGTIDGWPTLSPDGLEIYFESSRDGSARIYRAARARRDAVFSAPELIPELNGSFASGDPELSRDGRTIYFISTASGTEDIWSATRTCP